MPKPSTRRLHIKVLTDRLARSKDMVRYCGYADIPETPEPTETRLRLGKAVMHRFQEGPYTYFRAPSYLLAAGWAEQVIGRWASFGVTVEKVTR